MPITQKLKLMKEIEKRNAERIMKYRKKNGGDNSENERRRRGPGYPCALDIRKQ